MAKLKTSLPTTETPVEVVPEKEELWFHNETPSGITISYCPDPRQYKVNDTVVPSVTTVLDCLAKGGLSWWGMKIGVQGILKLWDEGHLISAMNWNQDKPELSPNTAESIIQLLTANRLTVNHQLKKAGDRGTSVHDAFEEWHKSGKLPFAANFPDEEKGYVQALARFLVEADPMSLEAEIMVGSAQHGYAGRYDIRLNITEPREVVVRALKKPKTEIIQPGTYLADLKTSSGVYPSHHVQLAAYEWASIECGYEPTDGQFIIHVTKDGQYEFVRSRGLPGHFLAVLDCYHAMQELK